MASVLDNEFVANSERALLFYSPKPVPFGFRLWIQIHWNKIHYSFEVTEHQQKIRLQKRHTNVLNFTCSRTAPLWWAEFSLCLLWENVTSFWTVGCLWWGRLKSERNERIQAKLANTSEACWNTSEKILWYTLYLRIFPLKCCSFDSFIAVSVYVG